MRNSTSSVRTDLTAPIRFRVLGPLVVERDGTAVSIGGPRTRAVLLRLLCANGRVVSAERIIDDLWGDGGASANTLQSQVSALRRTLGPDGGPVRDGAGYRMPTTAHTVDALEFERIVTHHDAPARPDGVDGPDRLDRLAALERALGWWRGDALDDVGDHEWARPYAARLAELRLAAEEQRVELLIELDRAGAAVGELEVLLERFPYHERFHALCALALYRSGRQADALRVVGRVRELLVEELGLDPGPELVDIEAAILRHDDSLRRPGSGPAGLTAAPPTEPTVQPAAAPPLAARPLPAAVSRRVDRVALVGRDAELTLIRERWTALADGDHRSVVALRGEAGAGKTRLAAEFARTVAAEGAVVLWGSCHADVQVPFTPVTEALTGALRPAAESTRATMLRGREALWRLLPALAPKRPGVEVAASITGSGDPEADRIELHAAATDLLEEVSAGAPVLVVLDDVQWLDDASAGLLAHVLRSERFGRMLVLVTRRTVPRQHNPLLDGLFTELQRSGIVTRIEVQPLDSAAIGAFLRASGHDDAAATVATLREVTGGNAFFLEEMLRHADQSGIDAASTTPAALPDSVREAIELRIARFDDDAVTVLRTAALIGNEFELSELAACTGADTMELLDLLDLAIDVGLLEESPDPGRVRFPHALVRQATASGMSRSRQAMLHLRIAEVLEARGGRSRSEVVHHYELAGSLATAEQLARSIIARGQEAMRLASYEAARTDAIRARALATDARDQAAASELLGDALRALGRIDEARTAYADGLAFGRQLGDRLLAARNIEGIARSRAGIGFEFGVDADVELFAEALADPPSDPRLHSRLLAWQVIGSSPHAPHGSLIDDAERAMALALEATDTETRVLATFARRCARWSPTDLEVRLASSHDAAARLGPGVALDIAMAVHVGRISDVYESGRLPLAEIEALRAISGTSELLTVEVWVAFFDAAMAMSRGDYDAATTATNRGIELGAAVHGANASNAWAAQTFLIERDVHGLAAMAELTASMAAQHDVLPAWRLAHALCALESGALDDARAAVASLFEADTSAARVGAAPAGISETFGLPIDSVWVGSCCLLAEIAIGLGEDGWAARIEAALRPFVSRYATIGAGTVSLGPVARYVGLGAAARGDVAGARRYLDAALEQATRDEMAPWEARICADLAALDGERRDPAEAAPMRRRTDDAGPAASAGDASMRRRADEIARSIGMIPPVSPLTRRSARR